MVSEKKIFLTFSHFKSLGAIYGHGGHLDLWTVTICANFQSPFNTSLHMKFEEIWHRGFRGEVVQRCERTDRWLKDNRQGVVRTAHPRLR